MRRRGRAGHIGIAYAGQIAPIAVALLALLLHLALRPQRPHAEELVALAMVLAAATLAIYLLLGEAWSRLKQDVREAEHRLAGILETAMDAIVTVDETHRIVLFNEAAATMFGVSAEEMLGRPLDPLLPKDVRAGHARQMERFARSGETLRRLGRPAKLRGRRSDGTEFPLEASLSQLDFGGRRYMTVVMRDASGLREMEEARQARAMAEAANRAKNAFLSRMSHELRTPLNAVHGFAQLLYSGHAGPLTPAQKTYVQRILDAGSRLLSLVEDVLDFSRIEGGQLRLQLEPIALEDAVHHAVALCQATAARHAVTCRIVPSEQPLAVWADRLRLSQVLVNLVSNGIKYNRPDGEVLITWEAREPQDAVCLRVSDTGVGMTQDQLEHLFEPFNRLGFEGSDVEGTGIGLTLAKELLANMKGSITAVHSAPGRGTDIEIALVRAPIEQVRAPAVAAPLSRLGNAEHTEVSGTVLYVEDNEVNVLLLRELMVRWPRIRFVAVRTAGEGRRCARHLRPEVILLDVLLPDGDGLSLLRELRQEPQLAHTRFVIVSASVSEEDLQRARSTGADAYWPKPLDLSYVTQRLPELLRQAGAAEERRNDLPL